MNLVEFDICGLSIVLVACKFLGSAYYCYFGSLGCELGIEVLVNSGICLFGIHKTIKLLVTCEFDRYWRK